MRRKMISAVSVFVFYLFILGSYVSAQDYASGPSQTDSQEGRYVLVTVNKPASYAGSYTVGMRKRTPAVVLDTYLGIVWRCQDIKDAKLLWIKTDLAKNTGQEPTKKKYVINVPPFTGEDSRIPAVVLDTEMGKTWICPDIVDENAGWVQTDLTKDIAKEGYAPKPY
ncbi:MAG: hypothetical protein HY350_00360 [Candidatus Omnitrophica bacterium]|nr:hypothetical protein [Candidatus Omnitrophota bacterium]